MARTNVTKLRTDIRAVRASIKKWKAIAEGTREDNGIDGCPLCKLYYRPKGYTTCLDHSTMNCNGCPVAEDTGELYCRKTPYEEWDDFWEEFDRAFLDRTLSQLQNPKSSEQARKLAHAEVLYLHNLLISLEDRRHQP